MAVTERVTIIANPARKGAGKMTLKQKKYFGSHRQRNAAKRALLKRRSAPKANRARHRKASSSRRRKNPAKRKNPVPGIISLTLGNPSGRKNVARTRRRKSSHRKRNAARRSARPAARRRVATNPARHRRRSRGNPSMQIGGLVEQGIGVITGAVGSKLLAQMVLGSTNTGPIGYAANAIAGGLLAAAAHMATKKKTITGGIAVGTVVQILLRVIGDYSLLGKYSQQLGLGRMLGDYQIVSPSWVTPQRLPDALHRADVEIPNGWAPSMMISAPAGVAGGRGFGSEAWGSSNNC